MRITTSLMAKAGAVVAAAAIAVSGVAAVADASTAAPARAKVATALSIHNTKPVAHEHQTTAIIGGRLAAIRDHSPVRGVWVFLQRKGPKGHFVAVKAERTGRHGRVAFRVHVFQKEITFRLVFRGNRNFRRAVSATDTIAPATK
jgi:hypothetical protein